MAWLRRFLLQNVPEDDPKNDRYIFLDQGGDLHGCVALQDLLKKEFFFELCPTGTQAHHQNGLVERPIQTIDAAIRCMLWGGRLLISYWPFAFDEYLAIKNAALPRRGATMSGDEKCSGKRTDLSRIHTFGCRVWVKHTNAKSKKYNVDTKKGRHLGHLPGGTKKNSLWVDDATGKVKLGYHLRFDEGMNDLTLDELPPNAKIFLHSGALPSIEDSNADDGSDAMMFYSSKCPFKSERTFTVKIKCKRKTFGIAIDMDEIFHKPFITGVAGSTKASIYSISSSAKTVGRNLKGAYIVAIDDMAIFSEDNVIDAFDTIRKAKNTSFKLTVGYLDKISASATQQELDELLLHTKNFSADSSDDPQDDVEAVVLPSIVGPIAPSPTHERNISTPTTGTRRSSRLAGNEAENIFIKSIVIKPHSLSDVDPFDKLLDNHDHIDDLLSDPEIISVIQNHLLSIADDVIKYDHDANITSDLLMEALQSELITPEEQALTSFTRRKLKTLSTWDGPSGWLAAEKKQLDQFHNIEMFGPPVDPPRHATVLRPQWNSRIKSNGTRRSCLCADGSKRAAPHLYHGTDTFASSLEQPMWRLFVALCAGLGLTIYGGDVTDAYAHAPGPTKPTFMSWDDAKAEWWYAKTGERIPKGKAFEILRAIQGHPEAGNAWERFICDILHSLGFRNATHEKKVHRMNHGESIVLLARQVDDFALGCVDAKIAQEIIGLIGECVQLPSEAKIPITFQGILSSFNGYDVLQTADYIQLSAESYLRRVFKGHDWEKPAKRESSLTAQPKSPLTDKEAKLLYDVKPGPKEGSPEHAKLARDVGYGYRNLLGEVLHGFVLCRLDISFAVTTLAKFSINPALEHYQALKRLAIYLRRHITWGIIYWRPSRISTLPVVDITLDTPDATLPPVPWPVSYTDPGTYVDASLGNIPIKMASTSGYATTMAGGAIAWRSKTQPITAQNVSEAELIAGNAAGKVIKYIRMVLTDLGFPPTGPSPIWEDNESVLKIVNHDRPTPRSCHIAIRYFGLQQWCELGELVLIHICGKINPSDALTKAMGWILHYRHCRFLMGYHGFRPHPTTLSSAASSTVLTVREGVSGSTCGHGTQEPGL